MDTDMTALRQDIKAVRGGLGALGFDMEALSREVGLPPGDAFDLSPQTVPEARRNVLVALWKAAHRKRNDPLLPLWVGAAVPFGCYEIIDYLCSACSNLGAGVAQLGRYLRLATPNMTLTAQDDAMTFAPRRPMSMERRVHGLYTVGITIARFRHATGVRFTPTSAQLAAPNGLDRRAVERWLGVPCTFGHTTSRLVFEAGTFDLPLAAPQPGLATVLERHADDLVKKRGLDDDPLGEVRAAIRAGLEVAETTLERSARRMAMGERTLQRRLADVGVSFQELLDEERRALSADLLADSRLAIGEVAFLLGYSEQSAFARAFKRWTGQAPTAYRRARPGVVD